MSAGVEHVKKAVTSTDSYHPKPSNDEATVERYGNLQRISTAHITPRTWSPYPFWQWQWWAFNAAQLGGLHTWPARDHYL